MQIQQDFLKTLSVEFGFDLEGDAQEACCKAILKACETGRWDLIKDHREAISKVKDIFGRTILMLAIEDPYITSQLIRYEIAIHDVDGEGNQASHHAAMKGAIESLSSFFPNHLSRDARNNKNLTPLHLAIEHGKALFVKHLFDTSTNLQEPLLCDEMTFTPLLFAIRQGEKECVCALLNRITVKDNTKIGNILHVAAYYCQSHIVEILLSSKFQELRIKDLINQQNTGLQTPLCISAEKGDYVSLELFVKHGALLDIEDGNGMRPIHHAAKGKHHLVVQRLAAFGCNVEETDGTGNTPMNYVRAKKTSSEESIWNLLFNLTQKKSDQALPKNGPSKDNLPTRLSIADFKDRKEILDSVSERAFPKNWNCYCQTPLLLLEGPPGGGKTAFTIVFANHHIEKFSLIKFISCANRSSYKKHYIELAKALRISTEKMGSFQEMINGVYQKLAELSEVESKPWLLIFDGVKEKIPCKEKILYPEMGGVVLLTTQQYNLSRVGDYLERFPYNYLGIRFELNWVKEQFKEKKYEVVWRSLNLFPISPNTPQNIIKGIYFYLTKLLPHLNTPLINVENKLLRNLLECCFLEYSGERRALALQLATFFHCSLTNHIFKNKMELMKVVMFYHAKALLLVMDPAEKFYEQASEILREAALLFNRKSNLSLQVYWEGFISFLHQFKEDFSEVFKDFKNPQKVREFQKTVSNQFKKYLVDKIFKDAFTLFPLQVYDLRVLGSLAKEEFCPFSVVQLILLVSNEKDVKDYANLPKFMELQFLSIGKTALQGFPDFHEDSESLKRLPPVIAMMNTPANAASYQRAVLENSNLDNLFFPIAPLTLEPSPLFDKYQQELQKVIPFSDVKKRALLRIKKRLEDYKKSWQKTIGEIEEIDLKNHYVYFLNHFLTDLSLYFGFKETNSIELINLLVKEKIFEKKSGEMLQESIAAIYMIRVRLHFHCNEPFELVSFNTPIKGFKLEEKEKISLKEIYWFILVPLYAYLEKLQSEQPQDYLAHFPCCTLRDQIFTSTIFSINPFQAVQELVSFLVEKGASVDDHFLLYQLLSKDLRHEHLRETYIDCLDLLGQSVNKLAHHPGPTGFRQSERLALKALHKKFRETIVTNEEKGGYGFSVKIESPCFSGPCFLKKGVINSLLDSSGNINSYLFTLPNLSLRFKQQDESNPYSHCLGREQAVNLLMMRFFGHGVFQNELVKFCLKGSVSKEYLVSVSHLEGKKYQDASSTDMSMLDPKRLSNLFLSVPLILPGNLIESHFFFRETKNDSEGAIFELVTTDNDVSWVKPITKNLWGNPIIQLYYPLFIKFISMPLNKDAIDDFLALQPEVLIHWLNDLIDWNENVKKHFKKFENRNQGFPLCLFEKGTGAQMLSQFFHLQAFLEENKNRPIHCQEILKTIVSSKNQQLFKEGSVLYKYYQKAEANTNSIPIALKEITGREPLHPLVRADSLPMMYEKVPTKDTNMQLYRPHEVRKEIILLLKLPLKKFIFSQNKGNHLKKCFEMFSLQRDRPTQQAILSALLLHQYTWLNLSFCDVLTDDLLEEFLRRNGNMLKCLDLRNCLQITSRSLVPMQKYCPHLKQLFLGSLEKMSSFSESTIFHDNFLFFPELKILDLSNCRNLKKIYLDSPKLTLLTAENNPFLEDVLLKCPMNLQCNFKNSPNVRLTKKTAVQLKAANVESNDSSSEEAPQKVSHDMGRALHSNLTEKEDKVLSSSSPSAEWTTQMQVWLDELEGHNPEFLKNVKSAIDNKGKLTENSAAIEPLVSKGFKQKVVQFAKTHSIDEQKLFDAFCNYLMDRSLSKKEVLLEQPSTISQTAVFKADSYDYMSHWLAFPNAVIEQMEQSNEVDFSIEKILSTIALAKSTIACVKEKAIISIVGHTGCGKSTTINFLYGCKMIEREAQGFQLTNPIDALNPVVEPGHTLRSQTRVPEVVSLKEINEELCDMPGFLETDGAEINIANAVNIRNVLIQAKSNRLVFLVDARTLDISLTRAHDFKNAVKILTDCFGSVEQLNQQMASILIGVTHAEKIPFQNIKNVCKMIAREHGWILENYLSNIVKIDPLERGDAPKRGEIITQIQSLSPIENQSELFKTALTSTDFQLIEKIAKHIKSRISFYWKRKNIPELIKEYEKLNSLACIEHISIEMVISETKTKILKKVNVLISYIKNRALEDSPEIRIAIKENMNFLRTCCQLDQCFLEEEETICSLFREVELELENCEKNLQTRINNQIDNNLDCFIQELENSLEINLKNQKDFLEKLDISHLSLVDYFFEFHPCQATKNLKYLFAQIEREIKIRPVKYYFGELVPLKTKERGLERIVQVITTTQKKGKQLVAISVFESNFSSCFIHPNRSPDDQPSLRIPKRVKPHELILLEEYGLGKMEVKQLIEAWGNLTVFLDPAEIQPYRERMEASCNRMYVLALLKNLEGILKNLKEQGLKQLNECFLELQSLDKSAYAQAQKIIEEVLIQKPKKELENHLADVTFKKDNYCSFIRSFFNEIARIDCFTTFFNSETIHKIKKELEGIVINYEDGKINQELLRYGKQLPHLLESVKIQLKNSTTYNPNKIYSLSLVPENIEQSLLKLKTLVDDVSSLYQMWQDLHNDFKTEKDRYYFTKREHYDSYKNQLQKIVKETDTDLVDYLSDIHLLAEFLLLQRKANDLFIQIEKESEHIIFKQPQKLIQHGIHDLSGFSGSTIKSFDILIDYIRKVRKNLFSFPEIDEIRGEILEKKKSLEVKMITNAKIANVKSTKAELTKISLERNFDPVKILELLRILKAKSPESYEVAKNELLTSLKSWQADFGNILRAENYSEIVKTYQLFKKLQLVLGMENIEFQCKDFLDSIESHLSTLANGAIKEIKYDAQLDIFFQITQLKKFMNVLRDFKNYEYSLEIQKILDSFLESLIKETKKRWITILKENIPENICILSIEDRKLLFNYLTKEIIKQYAIANELSMKELIQKIIGRILDHHFPKNEINSGSLIYQLGRQIIRFTDYGSSIDNSARGAYNGYQSEIIDTFPKFKQINIEHFNMKAGGVKFEDALKNFKSFPVNTSSEDYLKKSFSIFSRIYEDLVRQILDGSYQNAKSHHLQTTLKLAKELTPYADSLCHHFEKTAQLLGLIFAQWTFLYSSEHDLCHGKNSLLQPHSTQLLAIFRLIGIDHSEKGRNHLAQVKTGEGKSICLGITATLFALLGYKVNVACYSSYLSDRDYEAFSQLFASYSLYGKIWYSTITDLVRQALGVYLPNFSTMTKRFLEGKSVTPFVPSKTNRNLLLIDEVDVFFGENFYGQTYSPLLALRTPSIEELFRFLWEKKEEFKMMDSEQALVKLKALPCTQKILEEFPNLAPLLSGIFKDILQRLRYFSYSSFVLKEDRIGCVDEMGNLGFNYASYEITFTYLQYQEEGKIKNDAYIRNNLAIYITCARILYSEMPNFFELKLGLTATLEQLSEEENQVLSSYEFNHKSFIPSTFAKRPIEEKETIYVKGEKEEFFQKIKKEMDETIRNGRTALVFFKYTRHVEEFQTYLMNLQKNESGSALPELLTDMIEDQERKAIISRASFQGKLTSLTSVFGRGIDFICRDTALLQNGGVHIILTFYPETLIEEIQIKGRTCRQDNPGSIQKILFFQDLLDQQLISRDELETDDYKTFPYLPNRLDNDLSAKRTAKCSKKFLGVENRLKNNKEHHRRSLEFVEFIQNPNEKNCPLIYKMLGELNGYGSLDFDT